MQGREIVETLPRLLDDESEKTRQECSRRMGEAFSSFFVKGASPLEAERVFEIYRKFDLKTSRAGQNSTEAELRESASGLVTDLASAFQGLPQSSIQDFVASHWGLYREERATLFAARSKASHVSAVLRPFQKRYFDAFISILPKEDDANKYQDEINKLLSADCSSYLEILDWSHKVWALFLALAIFDKASDADRPTGMIGLGSVRTYRQQWHSWFENHSGLLLDNQSDDSPALGMPDESLDQNIAILQREVTAELHRDILQITPSEFELTVSVPRGSVSVTKSWMSQSEIRHDDVLVWIDSLGALLVSSSGPLLIKASASNAQNRLSVTFEAQSANSAADKTIELLRAFAR